MGKNQHVTPRPDGNWQVKGENNRRATGVYPTQQAADKRATSISKNQRSEKLVHGQNGQIRSRSTYKKDPFPPKG